MPQVSHECSYFREKAHCSHQDSNPKSLLQNVCLNCEFVKEINDSLDHMAFLSPETCRDAKKNFHDELKFDSPTLETNVLVEIPDIINETITEEDVQEFSQINETFNETFDLKSEKNWSRRSSCSLSETTLMLSDSDYEEAEKEEQFLIEYFAKKAKKDQLNRKKLLNDSNENNKNYLFDVEVDLAKIQQKNSMMSKILEENESWFCPRIDPPLTTELGNVFKANNEPYVKYYKYKDKFKMVLLDNY